MPTKNKTRKLSIVTKQMLLIGTVVWISICIIVAIITATRKEDMISLVQEECITIANMLSDYIEPTDLEKIIQNNGNVDEYNKLQLQLSDSMNNGHIQYLYTLWTDGNNVYYGVDGDIDNAYPYGTKFSTYNEYKDVFESKSMVDDNYAEYDGKYLISAYVPILNESGEVISALACDFNAEVVRGKVVKAWTWLFIWATMGLLLCSVALFIIVKSSVKKIILLNNKVDDIVNSNGDLTKELDVKSGDELELLANSINELMRYIREIIINISINANEIKLSSETMLKNTNKSQMKITDISATMQQMSAAMEETSASLSQVNTNITANSDAITYIAEQSETQHEYTKETMLKAEKTYQSAAKIKEDSNIKVQEIAASVNEKIKKSKSVEKINALTADILAIADQTNLLSLNASIEAARAGDTGRGFAVVAKEIGNLSKNSSEAAEQIKIVNTEVLSAVNQLAEEAEKMISFMESITMKGYQDLLDTSEEYKKDMEAINNAMVEFSERCHILKENTENISDSIDAINTAVEESANGINYVTEASVNLTHKITDILDQSTKNSEIAKELDIEVNKFKY